MTTPHNAPVASPHRLIRASAGSGKTFQLTNALLRLLLTGENAGDILATTFTRAAAGEILHRALARLSDAVVDADSLEELRRHVKPGLTERICAETLERIVGELHRLSVMTIDAFFARLATSFSFELGLAPGWRLLDEDEDAQVRASAVDRALHEAPIEEMLVLLRELHGDDARTHAHQAIMDVVGHGYEAYLETRGAEAPWNAVAPIGEPLNADAIADAIQRLREMEIPTTKQGKPRKHWVSNMKNAIELAERGDWEAFAGVTLVSRIAANELEFDRASIEDEHVDAFDPLIEHTRNVLTRDHDRRTRAMRRLLHRFDEVYTAIKRSLGGVTFSDPPRLLLEAGTTGELDHLYYRLDARIRHVLLDEFQDTSMTQFLLFEPILDELLSQAEDGRSVFCVGDIKQSLYAWRQAEPTLLPALPGRWPTLIEESLAQSWRSSPAVLDAVNAIFSNLTANSAMRSENAAEAAAREWDARFDAHSAAKPDLSGAARLTVADDSDIDDPTHKESRHAALRAAADRVDQTRRRAPGASIAVLVRRGDELRTVLGMLKRRGIDASEQRGNPLVDAPPVAAAVSLLRLIDHPGHTGALFHVASTPLGDAVGLRDPDDRHTASRVAARLRRAVAERGCAEVISQWCAKCADSMDPRGAARFEQFIDLAETFDAEGRGGPTDLANLAETRRIDEPGRAPVRVMTIHASKGLEFDVVVLPLISPSPWRVSGRGVIMDRHDPLGPVMRVSRYPSELIRPFHPELEAMHSRAMQKQINEELCCLYVAATRARRCLEMVVPTDNSGREGKPIELKNWRPRPDHVVRAALAPDAPAAPGAELWSARAGDDWASEPALRSPIRAAEPAKPVSLMIRAPAKRAASHLTTASPSQERAGAPLDASSILARRERRGQTVGELVHRWFELIEWLDDGAPSDDDLLRDAGAHGFDPELATNALKSFRTGIAGESVHAALSRSAWMERAPQADEARVWRERPFAARDRDRLLEGRFDRLVVGRKDGGIVRADVIDFKTDSAAAGLTGAELAAYAEHHRPQMEAYRRAAARTLNIPETLVAITLIFTAAAEATTLPHAAAH